MNISTFSPTPIPEDLFVILSEPGNLFSISDDNNKWEIIYSHRYRSGDDIIILPQTLVHASFMFLYFLPMDWRKGVIFGRSVYFFRWALRGCVMFPFFSFPLVSRIGVCHTQLLCSICDIRLSCGSRIPCLVQSEIVSKRVYNCGMIRVSSPRRTSEIQIWRGRLSLVSSSLTCISSSAQTLYGLKPGWCIKRTAGSKRIVTRSLKNTSVSTGVYISRSISIIVGYRDDLCIVQFYVMAK